MQSAFVSRLGSLLVAGVVTAGLILASTPLDAAAASYKTYVWRCSTRHHVRHCVRVAVWHRVATHRVVHRVTVKAKPAPKPAPKPGGGTTPISTSGGLVGQEIALVNRDRAAAGLPALQESGALDAIATARAVDMATNGYFAHYKPGHSTAAVVELLRARGVGYSWYGENIIWESGQPAAGVAGYFNTWWMNSPEHKANILNTHFGHIGVGVAVSGSRVYMVEDFTN